MSETERARILLRSLKAQMAEASPAELATLVALAAGMALAEAWWPREAPAESVHRVACLMATTAVLRHTELRAEVATCAGRG